MNPEPSPGASSFSQFQLIGGMKHDPADTFLLIEPGGAIQQRKGALYLAAEAAGEPALGGEATQLVLGTVAREYYEAAHPTVTTALTEALNRANQALIQLNRQTLAADLPPGMPRKIRVGLTAAVAKGGQLYLCQLKPSLAIFVHDGELTTFPRPRHWPEPAPQLNSDGVLMPNLYQASSLGSGPAVEVDFTHRRFTGDSLLVLCSSNLAPLLDPVDSREWLAGRAPSAVIEYLYNLARSHRLAESHAVAIDALGGGNGRRSTGLVYLQPAGREQQARGSRGQGAGGRGEAGLEARDAGEDAPIRPRNWVGGEPDRAGEVPGPRDSAAASVEMPSYLRGRSPAAAPASEQEIGPAGPELIGPAVRSAGPGGTGAAAGETFGRVMEGVGKAGKAAAPVVGRAGQMVGKAGKVTLGGVGTLLKHTLPESVTQRGGAGALDPAEAGTTEGEEEYGEDGDYEYEEEDEYESRSSVLGLAYGTPVAQQEPVQRPTWLKWLIPLVVVALIGVLVFSVQQVLAGQQAAKIDGLLAQAQQAESAGETGDTPTRRQHLLEAQKRVEEAFAIDPGSPAAERLQERIQGKLDELDNVKRLPTLTLLADLSANPPGAVMAETPAASAITGTIGETTPSDSGVPAAAGGMGDYLSQLLVRGDDVFLLDRGTGRIYRYSLKTGDPRTILSSGDSVEMVGDASNPAKVGQLLYMTWRPTAEGGDLLALDERYHAYIWAPEAGKWQAFALGGTGDFERPQDLGAYDGNLYILRGKSGQVMKWAAGAYNQPGTNWLTDQAANELRTHNPLAMAIDGEIHILLGSGQVVTAAAGEIKKTTIVSAWPPIFSPLVLYSGEDTGSFYIVEASDKRIIRVDKASGAVLGQLKAPVDSNAFDGLRNVYVDEQQGKIYVLSGKRLYTAELPVAAGVPPQAPAASPTATLSPVQANP